MQMLIAFTRVPCGLTIPQEAELPGSRSPNGEAEQVFATWLEKRIFVVWASFLSPTYDGVFHSAGAWERRIVSELGGLHPCSIAIIVQ